MKYKEFCKKQLEEYNNLHNSVTSLVKSNNPGFSKERLVEYLNVMKEKIQAIENRIDLEFQD